jgi:hypothetical protein
MITKKRHEMTDAIHAAEEEMEALADKGRELVEEGESMLARIDEQLRANPYQALGLGAGAGLLVGSLFGSRIGRVALLLAGGYVASEFVKRGGLDLDSEDEEEEEEEAAPARPARARVAASREA